MKRYNITPMPGLNSYTGEPEYKDEEFYESHEGEWVKFEDVKAAMEKIILIIEKGTPNRSKYSGYKVWEQKIIDLCEEIIESK
jgi:hypothetical protein